MKILMQMQRNKLTGEIVDLGSKLEDHSQEYICLFKNWIYYLCLVGSQKFVVYQQRFLNSFRYGRLSVVYRR